MDMKRMEQNAMKAYYNDIQNNPDYSSQVLIKERGISIRPTPRIMNPQPTLNISYSKNNMPVSIKPVPAVKPEYVWHQSKTDDGTNLMYYWNTETGESVWEPPVEGFLSVTEQEADEKKKEKNKKKPPAAVGPKAKKKKTDNKGDGDGDDREDDDGDEQESVPVRGEFEPFMAETTRIGLWKTVEKTPLQQVIDLQLPEQEFVAVKLPNTKEKEHTFKEKVIGNLDDAVSKNESAEMVSFKKSKFKNSNRRKRLDDD